MTDKSALEALKLPPEVLDLARKLEKSFKIGDGAIINVDKDVYASTLPEDISIETVQRLQKHHSHLVSASALALGNLAVPYMKKHKDVKGVELSFPVEKDKITGICERQREYPNRMKGGDEKIVKYGQISMDYTVFGSVNSRGSLGKIKGHIGEFAAASLAG